MPVEAEINAAAKNVCATNHAYVVKHLRSRYPACGARRVDVWLVNIIEVEGWHIRPLRVRLSLREEKTEAPVTHGQLVNDARRDHSAIAQRQIGCSAEDFTLRRIIRINLWPAIKRIALQRVVVREEIAPKHTVIGIKVVIDASVNRGTTNCCRRTP